MAWVAHALLITLQCTCLARVVKACTDGSQNAVLPPHWHPRHCSGISERPLPASPFQIRLGQEFFQPATHCFAKKMPRSSYSGYMGRATGSACHLNKKISP